MKERENFFEICQTITKLTAKQIDWFCRMKKIFPFVADLTHGKISLYVELKHDEDKFFLMSQHQPQTIFQTEYDFAEIEKNFVRQIEEPLIKRTFALKKKLLGRREWSLGRTNILIYTFPIFDNEKIVAVVSLEIPEEDMQMTGSEFLLSTAEMLLKKDFYDEILFRAILPTDGILLTNGNERIMFANEAGQHIFRMFGVGNVFGRNFFDRQFFNGITREILIANRPNEKEFEAHGLIFVQRNIPLVFGGVLQRRIILLEDVTQLRKREEELKIQKAIIKEMHHRVKNNLQTIASLLRMQSRRAENPDVKNALAESVQRILSISTVHDFLARQGNEKVDVKNITKEICEMLRLMMLPKNFVLENYFFGDDLILPSEKGANLALVINEILLNAIEHGFLAANKSQGKIILQIENNETKQEIKISDDGSGFDENFLPQKKSLGLQIIRTIVEGDLNGKFSLARENNLTTATILFEKESFA